MIIKSLYHLNQLFIIMYHKIFCISTLILITTHSTGQSDTLLYFEGISRYPVVQNHSMQPIPSGLISTPKNLVWRPLPSSVNEEVACIFPLLVMGKDQIDNYFQFETEQELEKTVWHEMILEVGLIERNGYYPDSIAVWCKSSNKYGLQKKTLLVKISLSDLCENEARRFSTYIQLPYNSKIIEIGAIPRELKKRSHMDDPIEHYHGNINFCDPINKLSDIPAGDSPLLFLKNLTILGCR